MYVRPPSVKLQDSSSQVANTPHSDAITSAGADGLTDLIEAGLGRRSNTVRLSILGYDQRILYMYI